MDKLLFIIFFNFPFIFFPHIIGTNSEDLLTPKTNKGCEAPILTLNGVPVLPRQNTTPDYKSTSEVRFSAQLPNPVATEPYRACKIKCVDGEWMGPVCQNDPSGKYAPILRNCELSFKNDSKYTISIGNKTLNGYVGLCPDRTVMKIKCKGQPGLYKQVGAMEFSCNDGSWSDKFPECLETNTQTDYSEVSPPTLQFHITSGTGMVDDDNNIVVFPGSNLHLECFYKRSRGTPTWNWNNGGTNYNAGWAIDQRGRDWTYRLSIYYLKPEDAGEFTCTTPRQRTNSINVKVAAVYCKELDLTHHKHLIAKHDGNHFGHDVNYSCPKGFMLKGAQSAKCLLTGIWSEEVPDCLPITCPELKVDKTSNLVMEMYDTDFGGEAAFKCEFGFNLIGQAKIVCGVDGRWSSDVPICKEIICPAPKIPDNGGLIDETTSGNRSVGTILQFACGENYQLQGSETIVCNDNGTWSSDSPTCKAWCKYPGEPKNGRIAPLKFQYEPGDKIVVDCEPGYVTPMLSNVTCMENGYWNSPPPKCTFYANI